MIWSLIFIANMVVLGIPSALLFIPWCWITGNVLPLYKATRFMLSSSCRLAGVRFRVAGPRPHPSRPRLHFHVEPRLQSRSARAHLAHPRPHFRLHEAVTHEPAHPRHRLPPGRIHRRRPHGQRADAQRSVAEAQRVLAKGVHITTFVEGTRSPDGRMLPFKKGPFFLAMAAGAPCIPVSIYGTEAHPAQGQPCAFIPAQAHVIFHEPIDPAKFASRDDLMRAVRAAIASGLPEWMRT